MLIFDYPSIEELAACIGKPLKYSETSSFDLEYNDNGMLTGSNRPHITGHKRVFYANVYMRDGLIAKVK